MDNGMLATTIGVIAVMFRAMLALAVAWGVSRACRWIYSQSRVLGLVVTFAVLIRCAIGLAMFAVSYWEMPLATSQQLGGGFWSMALDATGYYQLGARVAETGDFVPLDHVLPAPLFINLLGAWMFVVGVSPAAGMLLNVTLYVGLMTLVIWAFSPRDDIRADLPAVVAVTGYSFSPVMLFHATQPLKEEAFTFSLAAACLAVLPLVSLARTSSWRQTLATAATGAVAMGLAVFALAGVRWYFAIIVWGCMAAMLGLMAFGGRTTSFTRWVAVSTMLFVSAWVGFWGGAGPFYRVLGANFEAFRIVDIPRDMLTRLQLARTGFVLSGGDSNVVVPVNTSSAAGFEQAQQQTRTHQQSVAYREAERAQQAAEAAALGQSGKPVSQPPAALAAPLPTEAPTEVPLASVPERSPAFRAIPTTAIEQALTVVSGLTLLALPIPVAERLLGLDVPGGGSLLLLADLDTLFLSITAVLTVALLITRRHLVGSRLPLLVYGLILSATTAALIAYTVTNFGTLLRMRPMAYVPLWLSLLALGHSRVHREPPVQDTPHRATP